MHGATIKILKKFKKIIWHDFGGLASFRAKSSKRLPTNLAEN
jgi:hypothetical protein